MNDNIRGYVICGDGRSGTNLLCEAATATGKLGKPKEFFNSTFMRKTVDPNYPLDRKIQSQNALTLGMTSNGIYGLKLFAPHFDALNGIDWASNFPNLHFVFVTRRDLLMRAVSYDRAVQSGEWHSNLQQVRKPNFRAGAIKAQMERIALSDARWEVYFARNGIQPLRLIYEEFEKDQCADAIKQIAKLCEVDDLPFNTHQYSHTIQRNELSYEWARKFVENYSDRSYLDSFHVLDRHKKTLKILRFFARQADRARRIVNYMFDRKTL